MTVESVVGGVFGGDEELFANIQARKNTVLNTNPAIANNNITIHGSSWLWAVTALYGVLFFIVLAMAMETRHRQRVYHYLALPLLIIPTIVYYTMASNLGATGVPVEFRRRGVTGRTREVFWVRYIEWTLCWPIISLALLLMTAVGWSTILVTMGLAALFPIMLLSGAVTRTSYKWGYFVFALVAYFLLAYQLLHVARSWARRYETSKWYLPLTAYIIFMWALYFISWGLSEGGNVISNDGESVFYGVLDIFTKGLFGVTFAYLASMLDLKRLGLMMHDHGRITCEESSHYDKVRPGTAPTPGARDSGYEPNTSETAGTAGPAGPAGPAEQTTATAPV